GHSARARHHWAGRRLQERHGGEATAEDAFGQDPSRDEAPDRRRRTLEDAGHDRRPGHPGRDQGSAGAARRLETGARRSRLARSITSPGTGGNIGSKYWLIVPAASEPALAGGVHLGIREDGRDRAHPPSPKRRVSVKHWLGLEQRTALVTGASSGIGRAIAEEFGRCGVAVGVTYHSGRDAAQEVVKSIESEGGKAIALGGDVADPEACRSMVDALVERFGRLDILVANAGVQRDAPFTELSLSDWRRVIDTNLTGAFLCAQEAVRRFRAQPPLPQAAARGNIIFINSVHQVIPWAGHVNYAAAKGGMKLLMESLAQEVAHEKIRVNA